MEFGIIERYDTKRKTVKFLCFFQAFVENSYIFICNEQYYYLPTDDCEKC